MHSKIYQLSCKPITRKDWAKPEDYYDECDDFADYIGDEYDQRDRQEAIGYLTELLSDFMERDGDTLVYKSAEGLRRFLQDWVDAMKAAVLAMTPDNMFRLEHLWRLRTMTNRTHLRNDYRFKIENWNGDHPDTLDELIEYVKGKMTPGQRLYVGSVIDYHF